MRDADVEVRGFTWLDLDQAQLVDRKCQRILYMQISRQYILDQKTLDAPSFLEL
jgi:hypothetical protein